MQTPVRVSLLEFALKRNEWVKAHCLTDGDRQLCVNCKTPIEIISAYISIHDARFGNHCAGPGAVIRLVVPFCPKCEAKPQERGCLHEDLSQWLSARLAKGTADAGLLC
jgi:hypothetical protein